MKLISSANFHSKYRFVSFTFKKGPAGAAEASVIEGFMAHDSIIGMARGVEGEESHHEHTGARQVMNLI